MLALGCAALVLIAFSAAAEQSRNPMVLAQAEVGSDGDSSDPSQGPEEADAQASPSPSSEALGNEGDESNPDEIDDEVVDENSPEDYWDEGDPDGGLYSDIEEIQIQGQRGVITAVDSSDSTVAFSSQDLEALGVDDIADLAKFTPNLEIRTAGATSANFFIRGVGLADFAANAPSAVAIYQDGVPLNAPALQRAQIFDVGGVEIIRGPVGTGSGRNASAGVISFNARKPSGNFGANMLTRLYWFESPDVHTSAMGQEYEGGLDIPIFDDWLWSRFSFILRDVDPYLQNGCSDPSRKLIQTGPDAYTTAICGVELKPGNARSVQPGMAEFIGDQGNFGLRGQFRIQPTAWDMDWVINAHGGRLDQDSTLGQAIGTGSDGTEVGGTAGGFYVDQDQRTERLEIIEANGWESDTGRVWDVLGPILSEERPLDTGPYRGDYDRVGRTTLDTWGVSVTGEIFLADLEIVTVTGYEGYDRFRDVDQDFTPMVLFESLTTDSGWQFSEEIKVGGDVLDGELRWTTGGWFLMEKQELALSQNLGSELGNFDRDWSQDTYGFAVYGEFVWDFLEDFTLEGGIRYNWEEKSMDYFRKPAFTDGNRSFRENVWDSPTGTLQLKYRFTDMVAAYWKYTYGFKTGYFNANTLYEPAVEAEKINAIEAGFRGSWFDGILAMAGDVFYYRYTDYQVFVFSDNDGEPPVLKILNAPKAEVLGAELSLTLLPLQELLPEEWSGLRIQGEFGWLDSQFLEFQDQVLRTSGNSKFFKTVDYAGNRLPNSPDFTVALTAEWEVDLGTWGALVPRYDLQWTTDVFFDQTEGEGSYGADGKPFKYPMVTGQPSYALHNLQLLYRLPSGTAEVRIWGRNISDTRYKNFAFDASVFADVIINYVGPPRSVGFDLKFDF